jgi:hypothetical protein
MKTSWMMKTIILTSSTTKVMTKMDLIAQEDHQGSACIGQTPTWTVKGEDPILASLVGSQEGIVDRVDLLLAETVSVERAITSTTTQENAKELVLVKVN